MLPYYWNQLAAAWTNKMKKLTNEQQDNQYWENFLDGNLFDNITLSKQQIEVIQENEDQLLISGSAGSGKSLTLLGRMLKVMAESQSSQRILYVSFSPTLRHDASKRSMQSEIFRSFREKHVVHFRTFHNMVSEILSEAHLMKIGNLDTGVVSMGKDDDLQMTRVKTYSSQRLKEDQFKELPHLYSTHMDGFLYEEFLWMKANGIITEEHYLSCERTGRGINPRLTKEQRKTVFALFVGFQRYRVEKYGCDYEAEDYALLLLKHINNIPDRLKYTHIYVDEVQDLQPMQIQALVKMKPQSLTLSGDNKQRIYKRNPYSLRSLGVHVEGRRTKRLKMNYRSTKQIMKVARSLKFTDTENIREDDLVLFYREGPKPEIRYNKSPETQSKYLIKEIRSLRTQDPSCSIAIIHRYDENSWKVQHCPIRAALAREFELIGTEKYGYRFNYNKIRKPLFYTDAFAVKGLEFDHVFILHFDRSHYPKKEKLKKLLERSGGDEWSENYKQDEQEIFNEELKILYVALTRARERVVLLYSGETNKRISPFVRQFSTRDYDNYGFNKSPYGR